MGVSGLFSQANFVAHSWLLKPIAGGMMNGLLFPVLFGLPYLLASGMADRLTGIIAGLLGSAGVYLGVMLLSGQSIETALLGSMIGFALGISYHWWKSPLFYLLQMPYNQFLYRSEQLKGTTQLLKKHSAYWDEHQWLPLYGLDKHLVLVAERDAHAGKAAFSDLNHTKQRWAVIQAQLELYIRALEKKHSLEDIQTAHQQLPAFDLLKETQLETYLNCFRDLSITIHATISKEDTQLRKHSLEKNIDATGELLKDLTHVKHAQSLRLCRITEHWRKQLTEYSRNLNHQIELKRQIKNPYITGVPLTTAVSEVFVGRREVAAKIENLLHTAHAAPILLLGQRRMGKSSLLNHLPRFLPQECISVALDLQGISKVNSAVFFYNIARIVTRTTQQQGLLQLPNVTREFFQREPLTDFNEWLDTVEDTLAGKTLLLAFDELESLDNAFTDKSLEQDAILATLRHIIQHRSQFKILLAGNYLSSSWSSYLINMETLYLGYLKPDEARELILNPVKHELSYDETAINHILSLTRGHPALLQYLCKAIVGIKNNQATEHKAYVTATDVEAAVPIALQSATQFLIYIQQTAGELGQKVLLFIAKQGENTAFNISQLPFDRETLKTCLHNLVQQEIIEQNKNEAYQFQVEMMRRWFINSNCQSK